MAWSLKAQELLKSRNKNEDTYLGAWRKFKLEVKF